MGALGRIRPDGSKRWTRLAGLPLGIQCDRGPASISTDASCAGRIWPDTAGYVQRGNAHTQESVKKLRKLNALYVGAAAIWLARGGAALTGFGRILVNRDHSVRSDRR